MSQSGRSAGATVAVVVVMLAAATLVVVGGMDLLGVEVASPAFKLILLCISLVGTLLRLGSGSAGKAGRGSDRSAEEEGPPDSTPQLAGRACVHCKQKIVSSLDALLCKACKEPLHADCRKDHKADAHRPPARAAYR